MGEKTLTVKELAGLGYKAAMEECKAPLAIPLNDLPRWQQRTYIAIALAIKTAVEAPLLAEVERHRKEAMCANEHRVAQEGLRRQAEADLKAAQEKLDRGMLHTCNHCGVELSVSIAKDGSGKSISTSSALRDLKAAQEALEEITRGCGDELCSCCRIDADIARAALAPPAGEPVEEVKG